MGIEIRFYIGDHTSLGPFLLDRAITLGRGQDADLALPDTGLSRIHASVEPLSGNNGVKIQDLGSTNGIYHNRERIQEAYVGLGDQFWMGHTRVMVAAAGVAAQALPPRGTMPPPGGGPTPPPRQAYEPSEPVGSATMAQEPPSQAMLVQLAGAAGAGPPVAKTAPPFQAFGSQPSPAVEASFQGAPPGSGAVPGVARTAPPFPAVGGGGVAKTAPPFPSFGGGAAPVPPPPPPPAPPPSSGGYPPVGAPSLPAPAQAPFFNVHMGGEQRRVMGLDLHLVANEQGERFLRLDVTYEDPQASGATATATVWLQALG